MKHPVLLLAIFVVLILAWGAKHYLRPNLQECDACHGTGSAACGAPECDGGRVVCTGPCLKKDNPEWKTADIAGFPPGLLWIGFTNGDGSVQWVSQAHLGQVVENVGGRWTLSGFCRLCGGTSRMPCSACQAKIPCRTCKGEKLVNRWF
jgi:hypothetical protein